MTIVFDKYQKYGAYHWKDVEIKGLKSLKSFSLTLWTRYQIILKELDPIKMQTGSEIGCGDGVLSFLAMKKGIKSMLGCDTNQYGISLARLKTSPYKISGLVYEDKIFSDCMVKDASLDFVLMADVIEHLEQPKSILNEIKIKLKPQGKLIMTTPFKKDIGVWDTYHVTEYTDKTLKDLVQEVFPQNEVKAFLPLSLYNLYNKSILIKITLNILCLLGINFFSLKGKNNTMLLSVSVNS
jgi:2-polyprenyl-3-methyl-5-hydroxy-6-metoxy-1,4-benzoquinol methylase